jgi:hypothetical protein
MLPPKVFAIYRRETETFQFLTYETDDDSNIQRLKNWSQPRYPHGVQIGPQEDTEGMRWFIGTDWYVEPTPFAGHQHKIHQVVIHDKTYYWWSLHHKLVWASYMTYGGRNDTAHGYNTWNSAPQIPVIEFNSRLIYPRLDVLGFYPRWCTVKSPKLDTEMDNAHATFMTHKINGTILEHIHDHVDPKHLKIRTPVPKEKEKETTWRGDQDDEEFTPLGPKVQYVTDLPYHDESATTCGPIILLTIMLGTLVGTWTLIGLQLATGF